MSTDKPKQPGAFSKLFSRQQKKVNAKPKVGKVLRQFADEDLKHIAALINHWLKEDEKKQSSGVRTSRARTFKGK